MEAKLSATHFGPVEYEEAVETELLPALDEPPTPGAPQAVVGPAVLLAIDSQHAVRGAPPVAAEEVEAETPPPQPPPTFRSHVAAALTFESYSSMLLKKEFSPSWPLSTKMRESTTHTAT